MSIGDFLGKGFLSYKYNGINYYLGEFPQGIGGFRSIQADPDKTQLGIVLNLYTNGIGGYLGNFLFCETYEPISKGANIKPFWGKLGSGSKMVAIPHPTDPNQYKVSVALNDPATFNGYLMGVYDYNTTTAPNYPSLLAETTTDPTYFNFKVVTPGIADWKPSGIYKKACVSCDLTYLDYSGKGESSFDLNGSDLTLVSFEASGPLQIDFSKALFNRTNLSNIVAENCVFDSVNFNEYQGAILEGAQISNSSFKSANLYYMGFNMVAGPKLHDCIFDDANVELTLFSNVDLTGSSFVGVDLRKTFFNSKNILAAVNFQKANLSNLVNFAGVDFHNSNFTEAILTNTNLKGCKLYGCTFDGQDLTKIILDAVPNFHAPTLQAPSADNPRTSFVGATLPASLIGLNWSLMDLTDATINDIPRDLDGLNAQYAKLTGKVFQGATVRGANFANADLNVELGNINLDPFNTVPTSFEGAILNQTNLSGARLVGANLSQIQGGESTSSQSVKLSQAYMPNAILTGAILNGANLSGAQIYGPEAKLDNAVLEDADLSNTTLSELNLSEARLRGANFDHSNLIGATLTGVKLTPSPTTGVATSFVGANLIGTNFAHAELAGTILTDAAVALPGGVPFFQLDNPTFFEPELDKNQLSGALRNAFSERGRDLQHTAAAITIVQGSTWLILEYPDYELTYDSSTKLLSVAITGVDVLQICDASALLPELDKSVIPQSFVKALEEKNFYLNSSAQLEVDASGAAWSISQLPTVEDAVGYQTMGLNLIEGKLAVFGTKFMTSRLTDGNKLELVIVDVTSTTIKASQFDASTICPNRVAYGEQRPGITWMEMMTAPKPPSPPTCVPSGDRWCMPPDIQ